MPACAVGGAFNGHAGRKLYAPDEACWGGPVERQTFDQRRIGKEEVGDCPIAKNVVAKSHAVISEIAQSFARYQGVDRRRRKLLLASSCSTRESACSASALSTLARSRWFSSFSPSAVCHHCSAISTSVRGTGALDGRLARRERRNRFRATWRAGWLSANSAINWGAAFRNSSVSAFTQFVNDDWFRHVLVDRGHLQGSQLGSAIPKSRRAVAITENPGTLAASRTRSTTVSRSSSP